MVLINKMKGSIMLAVLFIVMISSKFLTGKECESKCSECQKTVYKLKFQKIADCKRSLCKSTVIIIYEI